MGACAGSRIPGRYSDVGTLLGPTSMVEYRCHEEPIPGEQFSGKTMRQARGVGYMLHSCVLLLLFLGF